LDVEKKQHVEESRVLKENLASEVAKLKASKKAFKQEQLQANAKIAVELAATKSEVDNLRAKILAEGELQNKNIEMYQKKSQEYDDLRKKYDIDQENISKSIKLLKEANLKLAEVARILKDERHIKSIEEVTAGVRKAVEVIRPLEATERTSGQVKDFAQALERFKRAFENQGATQSTKTHASKKKVQT
jgi:hypothetical protein